MLIPPKVKVWLYGILAAIVATLLGTSALRRRAAQAAMRRTGAKVEALDLERKAAETHSAAVRERLVQSRRVAEAYASSSEKELNAINKRIAGRDARIAALLAKRRAAERG